ncbi:MULTISPECIES: Phenylacetic acid catabolic protein [unclassified Rhizobium]|jgi:ring-1,2-phenylacetyl-CoA epoxidase subunit PaaA|uniref:Phenylacetic acid catabolic protein n=1 Tax=unclassified Rhizobium TaxID=2613769 RepID=UPI0006486111|nr:MULTISPECIES: Phenylacetic acid catabolic protein [unclassified Rhizobium]MBN8953533.1 phenylacetate-CoA oxygenase subunit PaaI [Rhizobium tropici]OJY73265.1 MAG: phenylacetic acid catabolic [Rhizobium sp. 60-20]RKD72234.1 1,2-phenylacetyl-CoA epoxidase catalytic subunit [Rhizobium sp. WW_1]
MSDTMPIEQYLEEGGMLSSPDNVPPRYRGELLRLMASFVDSELAGSAGFADIINDAPGIQERISAARIVLEKTDHAGQVLKIMETFGVDGGRYAVHHPWAVRLSREADIGAVRQGGDMRLSVFHYPLEGWVDAVVMNVLMGAASVVQLKELARVSYQPLAEVFRAILPREKRHAELGVAGLARIVAGDEGRAQALVSIAYWYPRVAASFGHAGSTRFETLSRFGLRHTPNETLLADWRADVDAQLSALGLN